MESNIRKAACILHCMAAGNEVTFVTENEENDPEPGGLCPAGGAR